MTMITDEKLKCALCGTEGSYSILYSTNCFGPCDLDTRPAPMERDTLSVQIQVCQNCGYSNYDITTLDYPNVKEIVKSKKYQDILNTNLPTTAKNFYLFATIAEENKENGVAGYALLKAAWACDDCMELELAMEFRKKSIINYLNYLKKNETDETKLILLDLYRRTKQFDKVIEYASNINFVKENELFDKIRDCEIRLSQIQDSDCHNLGEI